MSRGALAMVSQDDEPDEFARHPELQASDEVCAAANDLDRPASQYFRFPWNALDGLVGGIPRGDVWYIGAFSGHGKTTFLTSLLDACYERGDRVYYMGLESRPKTLRTHWACKRLGYDAGKILTGDFHRDWQPDTATKARAEIREEMLLQARAPRHERVRFCPTPFVDYTRLWRAAEHAMEFNADVFIVDHVDHIRQEDDAKSGYQESVRINQALLEIAQQTGMRVFPATQFNNDAVRGNRLALHFPPQPQYVKMGGHKREVGSGMLGLYKPLKLAGVDKGLMKSVQSGHGDVREILEPNTMAVYCMKHRHYGAREGAKIYLRVEHGKVLDANQALYTHRTADADGFRRLP